MVDFDRLKKGDIIVYINGDGRKMKREIVSVSKTNIVSIILVCPWHTDNEGELQDLRVDEFTPFRWELDESSRVKQILESYGV